MSRRKKYEEPTIEEALEEATSSSTPQVPAVTYRALLRWENGVPTLVEAITNLSDQPEDALRSLMRKCLDLPYDGKDPSLAGLSQGEAMVINLSRDAARGIPGARDVVLDRLLGKPQQNIKSVNMTGDINDFLDRVATQTRTTILDVTPNKPPTSTSETEDL
jgi:hypothetical protein